MTKPASSADPLSPERPPLERLIAIMARLRDPARGCPWDVEQNFATIAPYTIEEAYEVADAIQHGDMAALKDELGDLLLQVVFHAQMAREAGAFGIEDVARAINDKMIKRHPHVFADAVVEGAEAQTHAWEAQKAAERAAKGEVEGRPVGALDGVAVGLPALTRALKLQRRAARVGFDWPAEGALEQIEAKLAEELGEIRAEVATGNAGALVDECGDLLFVCVNLLRHLGVDPESALRGTNAKFERRFQAVEARIRQEGIGELAAAGIERLEAAWQAVKAEEWRAKR
ncbi:MAG TPA: nucleoside triphosphate pyrophosphohydrolase [Dongiaceae bacterium]|nr:nucleoside triphosphate pyrophosphohydrolase [Dongiaceae bacterium]